MGETSEHIGIRLQATAQGKEQVEAVAKAFDKVDASARKASSNITKHMKAAADASKSASGASAAHWAKHATTIVSVLSTIGNTVVTVFKVAAMVISSVFRAALSIVRGFFGVIERVGAALLGIFKALGQHVYDLVGRLAKAVGTVAALSAGLMLVGSVKAAATFAKFEQSVRNAMTTTGLFGDELTSAEQKMTAFARKVAASSTFKASDIGEAYYSLASSGLNVSDIVASTPGVIALAEATKEPIASTVELVTAVLKSFRMEAAETARVVNVLAAGIASSPLNMNRLAESMKYVAPVAATFRLSVEDVTAALGVLAQQGIHGSEAGTALRAIMLRVTSPRRLGRKEMAAAGLTPAMLNPQNVGVEGMISGLSTILARRGIGGLSRVVGLEGTAAAAALATSGASAYDAMLDKITGTNLAFQMQQLQLNTISGQWEILLSVIEEAQHSFGEGAKSGIMAFLQSMQSLIDALTHAGVFSTAGQVFGVLAQTVGAFGAVVQQYAPWFQVIAIQIANVFLAIVQWGAERAPMILNLVMQFLARLPYMLAVAMNLAMSLADWALNRLPTLLYNGLNMVGQFLGWLSGALAQASVYLRTGFQEDVVRAIDMVYKFADSFLTVAQIVQTVCVVIGAALYSLTVQFAMNLNLLSRLVGAYKDLAIRLDERFYRKTGDEKYLREANRLKRDREAWRAIENGAWQYVVETPRFLAKASDTSMYDKARGAMAASRGTIEPAVIGGLQRLGQGVASYVETASNVAGAGANMAYTAAGAFSPNQTFQGYGYLSTEAVYPEGYRWDNPAPGQPWMSGTLPMPEPHYYGIGSRRPGLAAVGAGVGSQMVFNIYGTDKATVLSAVGRALDEQNEQTRRNLARW